ncbi:hypothetical protein [Mycobacterium sp.]|uniref:hypothetical protein n=1 Tax=Mycobacterium sp. TaxID=1785 RepID=UPI003BABAE77
MVYDHRSIAERVSDLRRIMSRSESALDHLRQAQASLSTSSHGATTRVTQESLAQLVDINRKNIASTSQLLDALDLASAQMADVDRQLAWRFGF